MTHFLSYLKIEDILSTLYFWNNILEFDHCRCELFIPLLFTFSIFSISILKTTFILNFRKYNFLIFITPTNKNSNYIFLNYAHSNLSPPLQKQSFSVIMNIPSRRDFNVDTKGQSSGIISFANYLCCKEVHYSDPCECVT